MHYKAGVRLMPLGTFRKRPCRWKTSTSSPTPKFGSKVLIVNFLGYHDFFSSFLAEGLEKQGMNAASAS